MNYYNEFDPKAAAWLRELIAAGHIPPGEIDTRSITEISPDDLRPFTQCHFFAGIAGWPLALHLAGVDATRPLWTGSCPCQPFSVAGKGLGEKDERHLWPVFARLIAECRPPIVLGEQVASKAGREWLAGVFADLEGMGYAVAGADLCAAGVGAPHIRQRLYWVADAEHTQRRTEHGPGEDEQHRDDARWEETHGQLRACREVCGGRRHASRTARRADQSGERQIARGGGAGGLAHADMPGGDERARGGEQSVCDQHGESGGVGDANGAGLCEQCRTEPVSPEQSAAELRGNAWDSFDLLHCTDGKTRRIESGTFPLAHGVPGRVGLLRGYGNAIVPKVAAEFIRAFMTQP